MVSILANRTGQLVPLPWAPQSKESTVREFHDGGATICNDVVVGQDDAIFAYEEAAAVGNSLTI